MKYAVMILFLSAGLSMAADDEASKKLLKSLEGTYKITALEFFGGTVLAQNLDGYGKRWIKGDKFSFFGGKSETREFTILLDATKKPAHFDLTAGEGNKKDKSILGIIAIDGETIKICLSETGNNKRPTEFKANKDDGYAFFTLKKVKE